MPMICAAVAAVAVAGAGAVAVAGVGAVAVAGAAVVAGTAVVGASGAAVGTAAVGAYLLHKKRTKMCVKNFVLVYVFTQDDKLCLTQMFIENDKIISTKTTIGISVMELFDLSKLGCNGVILNIFSFQSPCHKNNLGLWEELKSKFDADNIQYYFISHELYLFGSALTKCGIKLHPNLVFVIVDKNNATSFYFSFTDSGYQIDTHRKCTIAKDDEDLQILAKLFQFPIPEHVCAFSKSCDNFIIDSLKRTIPNLTFLQDVNLLPENEKFFLKSAKLFVHSSYTKYFIHPFCTKSYFISSSPDLCDILAEANYGKILPQNVSTNLTKIYPKVFVCMQDITTMKTEVLSEIELSSCHQSEIVFSIDGDNCPSFRFGSLMLPEIESIPKKDNITHKPDNLVSRGYEFVANCELVKNCELLKKCEFVKKYEFVKKCEFSLKKKL